MRRSLVVPVSLRTKLLVSVSGVAILPVIFAVLLAHTEATRALRDFAIGWQAGMLDAARARLEEGSLEAEISTRARAPRLAPESFRFRSRSESWISPRRWPARSAALEDDVLASFERAIATGRRAATAPGCAPRTWSPGAALPDRRILMALSPSERLRLDQAGLWTVFALLLVASTSVAGALAWLLAQDVEPGHGGAAG